jgi:tetratricopeptide (TPR) repeat protein
MSLLMDALKKAELAKRQGQADGAGPAPNVEPLQNGLALEPLGNANPPLSGLEPSSPGGTAPTEKVPNLPSHLEELDAQFLAEAKQAASARLKTPQAASPAREAVAEAPTAEAPGRAAQVRTPATETGAPRQSAQNLFAAKQSAKPPARKSFALTIGALTVLAVSGIGGYFWWQLQPKSMPIASRPATPPTPVSMPAPVSAPVAAPQPPAAVATAATAATSAASPARAASKAPPDADDDAPPTAQRFPRRQAPATPPTDDTDSVVRVARTPLKVNPALLRGFDAFNRGDLALAQMEYERAQKSDPRNTDVLHGLAAIALRQGRPEQAEMLYRQITEADPQDAVAMAALINARGQIDPGAAESRLKSMSAAQPELAAPHFSLGNLYARHGRWADAQQAYFRAYTAESDNPDILYNLAISLEHLRQNKLAAQYYSQALAAAESKPAGFDKAQAAARLATLKQ